ncbi:hypothetical protein [Streptomyces albogriseolus]|uniref:hypothetical protein n=1 Tax=Streptomyces albogriseolus TaxID=1887 RepID=UPI003CF61CAA
MALSVRLAAVGMAATALALGAGVAHAQEAPLVSVLDGTSVLDEAALAPNVSPGVALICAQNGQQGKGNIIGGDLTQSCSQTATQTNTGDNGNGGGGLTGRELVYATGIAEFNETIEVTAVCPEGKTATGGGYAFSGIWENTRSQPSVGIEPNPREGWTAIGRNINNDPSTLTAVAVCYDKPS